MSESGSILHESGNQQPGCSYRSAVEAHNPEGNEMWHLKKTSYNHNLNTKNYMMQP